MAKNDVRVESVTVARPATADAATASEQKSLQISVDIENTTSAPQFAWSTTHHFEYDPASKMLTIHMEEVEPTLPPGLVMISDHPRTPPQVEVAPGAKVTIQVSIPSIVRRAAPDGTGWVEQPIGEIDQVDVRLQHSPNRVEAVKPNETSAQFRARAAIGSAVFTGKIAIASGGAGKRK